MSLLTWLLWGIILAVFCWCVYWHSTENSSLIRSWKDIHGKKQTQLLSGFAWGRSFQLFGALALLLIMVSFYSWQIASLEEQLEQYEALYAASQSSPPVTVQPQEPVRKPIAENVAQLAPAPVVETPPVDATPVVTEPASPPVIEDGGDDIADIVEAAKIIEDTPEENIASTPDTAPEPEPEPEMEAMPLEEEQPAQPVVLTFSPIVDVFTPGVSESGDNHAAIDHLKQQYENTLVLYFIMSRCKFVLSSDYGWIMAALRQEMHTIGAPLDLQEKILDAAKGTYQELYAYNKCDSKEITDLASQFRKYINSLYQMKFTQ